MTKLLKLIPKLKWAKFSNQSFFSENLSSDNNGEVKESQLDSATNISANKLIDAFISQADFLVCDIIRMLSPPLTSRVRRFNHIRNAARENNSTSANHLIVPNPIPVDDSEQLNERDYDSINLAAIHPQIKLDEGSKDFWIKLVVNYFIEQLTWRPKIFPEWVPYLNFLKDVVLANVF